MAVRVVGPEPEAHYVELLRAVDEHAPVLDVFRNEVRVETTVMRPSIQKEAR
jgi:hypothetical protein